MLSQQLANGLEYLARHMVLLPEPYPGCILFFTVAAENKAASVFPVRATTLEAADMAVTASVSSTRGEVVYGVVDTSVAVSAALADQLRRLDGVTMVRVIA